MQTLKPASDPDTCPIIVMKYTLGPILIFFKEDYARTESCSWTATAEISIKYLSGRKNLGKSSNRSLLHKKIFLLSIPNFVCFGEGTDLAAAEEIY